MRNLPPLVFAAIGIDHRHSYDQVQSLLDVGGTCVGWWTEGTPKTHEGFVRRFPQIPRVDDRRRLVEDPRVALVTCFCVYFTKTSQKRRGRK